MDRKTIAAAIGAVVLTAGAGATTWAVVFDQQAPAAAAEPIVTTVYVDQFGNPVDPATFSEPATAAAAPTEPAPAPEPSPAYPAAEFEKAEYTESEYEEYEESEYEEAEGSVEHEEAAETDRYEEHEDESEHHEDESEHENEALDV